MAFQKVVFWQLEDNSKEHEQLCNDLIIDVSTEVFNLGPIFLYNLRMWSRILWNEFGNIVNLGILHFGSIIIRKEQAADEHQTFLEQFREVLMACSRYIHHAQGRRGISISPLWRD